MEVRDAGAQAGHDQTNEAGSQAADTTSDGTPSEPPRRSCPVPQRAHPKYATPSNCEASLNRWQPAMAVWRQIRPNWRLSRPVRSFRRSGARLLVTLLYALRARGRRRGVASLCLGGGEAVALAVEAL